MTVNVVSFSKRRRKRNTDEVIRIKYLKRYISFFFMISYFREINLKWSKKSTLLKKIVLWFITQILYGSNLVSFEEKLWIYIKKFDTDMILFWPQRSNTMIICITWRQFSIKSFLLKNYKFHCMINGIWIHFDK